MTNRIELRGCAPAPLIHYLKALGILRLVAEQLDETARGSWLGDTFVLETTKNKEELVRFFLDDYSPTPIVAPWNGSSGFYPKDVWQRESFEKLWQTNETRFADYAATFAAARSIVGDKTQQPKDDEKTEMLRRSRQQFPDRALDWLDAAFALGQDKPDYPPLLGSGGNDGRLDFTINFVSRLLCVLPEVLRTEKNADKRIEQSAKQLRSALFAEESASLEKAAVGQFYPAGAGGANMDNAATGAAFVNPWDFILAIEGTLMLASATVRQLAAGARSKASFPFTVRNSNIGYGTATENEKIRAEMWLPVWSRSTSYQEISQIFKEGRVQFSNRRPVRTGFDFARAVAELGVDRGIDAFQRYAFIERNGQANLATPLGRFEVPKKELPLTSLINDEKLNDWLARFNRAIGDKTPARFVRVRKRIEEAIFAVCASSSESEQVESLRETLIALGQAESELANGETHRSKNFLQPLSGLKRGWAFACNDNSSEFDIAAALAAISGNDKSNSFRANLESFDDKKRSWSENDNSAVWTNAAIAENLSAVLQRRAIEARQNGVAHPLLASSWTASLDSVGAFLNFEDANGRRFDDAKLEDFLHGLVLIDWRDYKNSRQPSARIPANLPRAYALLKLLFLPEGRFRRDENALPIIIKHEPSIVPLLRANRVADAIEIAVRRLKSSGLIALADEFYFDEREGARLAAALLIPVHETAVFALAELMLRPKTENS